MADRAEREKNSSKLQVNQRRRGERECVRACVRVCVCECVYEMEREREGECTSGTYAQHAAKQFLSLPEKYVRSLSIKQRND